MVLVNSEALFVCKNYRLVLTILILYIPSLCKYFIINYMLQTYPVLKALFLFLAATSKKNKKVDKGSPPPIYHSSVSHSPILLPP